MTDDDIGKLSTLTADERAETLRLARAIIEAEQNDEEWPLGLPGWPRLPGKVSAEARRAIADWIERVDLATFRLAQCLIAATEGRGATIPDAIEHAPTCATGARAEIRGPCDCGATRRLPYRIRAHPTAREPDGRRLVEIEVESPITGTDAVMLSIALQELTRIEGQRWARADAKRTIPTIARTGMVPLEVETCAACGHRHAGPEAGGICIGCPCEVRP